MALSTPVATTPQIYGPVEAARKELRLLRMLPGSKSSPVRCVLTDYYMPDAPEFLALSYTWGQPDPNCHIEVNSCSLGATKNLSRFLRQIRSMPDHAHRYFWIDAVCVDQSNVEERGQQVGLMASIYASATLVILWLGPAYADSDVAMRNIAKMGSMLPSEGHSESETKRDNTAVSLQDIQLAKIWRKRSGNSIRQLCERRYWTRLWVLQELTLAQDIRVLCGKQQIRWSDLRASLLPARQPLFPQWEESRVNYESCMGSPCKEMLRQVDATNAQRSLYDQVLAARHLQCLDPRDKVYGVGRLQYRSGWSHTRSCTAGMHSETCIDSPTSEKKMPGSSRRLRGSNRSRPFTSGISSYDFRHVSVATRRYRNQSAMDSWAQAALSRRALAYSTSTSRCTGKSDREKCNISDGYHH